MTRLKIIRGIIERDGEAPIAVAGILEIHGTPMKPPGGRPKATAKHAAVVMAFHLDLLRQGNKPFKAGDVVAREFGYRGERQVRRIIKSKQNPLRGANGHFVIQMGGSVEVVIATYHPGAVVVTEATIHIDGRGWAWRSDTAEAVYGEWRGRGMIA